MKKLVKQMDKLELVTFENLIIREFEKRKSNESNFKRVTHNRNI